MRWLACFALRVMLPAAAALAVTACVVKRISLEEVPRLQEGQVTSPVKLHLFDGSTVTFAEGIRFAAGWVHGRGVRYDLALRPAGEVQRLSLDSVAAMESYRAVTDPVSTTLLTSLGVVAAGAAGAVLAVAIFGSCPTVYTDSAGTPVLQAESFSYSIAPLFEARDVDRLRLTAAGGMATVEIRNEALETHYINHLELLEITHPADALVLPDAAGRPLVVRGLTPPRTARDRAGRDRTAELARADDQVFRSDTALLRAASARDHDDWIDLAFPAPAADSAALVLRLQNSLLTTVLFYDVMLGELGHRAVDWMARDLERIDAAVALGRWARERLGLRVEVFDGAAYRPAGTLRDVGPIVAKDVALVVPMLGTDTVRLRIRFTVDSWRIDHAALASSWRRAEPRALVPARITDGEGTENPDAITAVTAPDARYLETRPGQRFFAQFAVGDDPADATRTFLLAAQGYYIEWVRRSWFTAPPVAERFSPGPEAIARAIARWRETQDTTERAFYATRIPVR